MWLLDKNHGDVIGLAPSKAELEVIRDALWNRQLEYAFNARCHGYCTPTVFQNASFLYLNGGGPLSWTWFAGNHNPIRIGDFMVMHGALHTSRTPEADALYWKWVDYQKCYDGDKAVCMQIRVLGY